MTATPARVRPRPVRRAAARSSPALSSAVPSDDDRGSVTAELALGMVAVVLVLAALLVTTSAVATRMRCLDAARSAARVAALRVEEAQVVAAAHRVAPGARVVVAHDQPWVEVTVSSAVGGSWFTGGALTVSGSAVAWVEPGGAP